MREHCGCAGEQNKILVKKRQVSDNLGKDDLLWIKVEELMTGKCLTIRNNSNS